MFQAVSDIERQWTQASKDQIKHLNTLQQRGSKREVGHMFLYNLKMSLVTRKLSSGFLSFRS